MSGISTASFALRLLLSIVMGAIRLAWNVKWRQRIAGTRTNALVAAVAGAFVMCGLLPLFPHHNGSFAYRRSRLSSLRSSRRIRWDIAC